MDKKAIEFAADHPALSMDENPFLLVDLFTLQQLDSQPAAFTGLLDPFVAVPANSRLVRFVRTANPDIALVIRTKQVGGLERSQEPGAATDIQQFVPRVESIPDQGFKLGPAGLFKPPDATPNLGRDLVQSFTSLLQGFVRVWGGHIHLRL
jgi:hypothetical protein